jgi:hypothetical protein
MIGRLRSPRMCRLRIHGAIPVFLLAVSCAMRNQSQICVITHQEAPLSTPRNRHH